MTAKGLRELPEEVITRIAAHLDFPDCLILRDSGLCPDITDVVDANWKLFRRSRPGPNVKKIGRFEKKTHIYVYGNSSSMKVVVRSRGAANLMCLWDTRDDTFITGQWLCRKPLVPDRCAYLDNGLFIWCTAEQGHFQTIGVSTPPYFTAHALWQGMCCLKDPYDHILSSPIASFNRSDLKKLRKSAAGFDHIESTVLRNEQGLPVYDFTSETFRQLAAPDDYVLGRPTSENKTV